MAQPSRTALLSAAARAAHLLVDERPPIFADTLAKRFLGERAEELLGYHQSYGSHPALSGARTTAVTRSRYTEDRLAEMAADQYVILGAGLDSFAYRTQLAVRVFEVDKPATQRWKQQLLADAGITAPKTVSFVAVDFEQEPALTSHLVQAGFDLNRPALVSWLGVTMYLTAEAISETLDAISGFAPGTELIVEHLLPAALRDEAGQTYAELVMAAAAEHGEPWRTFLDPDQMAALLRDHGLEPIDHVRQRETLSPAEWKREDALRPAELSVLTRARVTAPSPATDPTAAADTPTNTQPKPPAPRP
ncbi:class I SAM-dependent methyltransferase [Amycolatopsis sp. WGS_07]|uniref:class I SAM-dependent methyltransferase n=1 Tax=Amycolatopsis sp. WGS_07 TaxID=3076764 RepID=UPI0038737984